ncbi:hypothetical protein MJH12_02065 [bacterium]|nr:hypothetical protein [bacterium]
MKVLFLLFLTFSSSFSQVNEFTNVVFVNGKARPATFHVSRSSESWFTRERFFTKTGKIVEILSPDTFLIQTDSRLEEVRLIGLLDISAIDQPQLNEIIKKQLRRKYLNKKVKIFKPKVFEEKGLEFNHAYLIKKEAILNLEILQQGLGIVHDGQEIYRPIRSAFIKAMEDAEKRNKGLWRRL